MFSAVSSFPCSKFKSINEGILVSKENRRTMISREYPEMELQRSNIIIRQPDENSRGVAERRGLNPVAERRGLNPVEKYLTACRE